MPSSDQTVYRDARKDAARTARGESDLYEAISAYATSAFKKAGLSASEAATNAEQLCDHVADALGGQLLYVGKRRDAAIRRRNAEIVAASNGKNVAALVKRFGLGFQTIYKILAEDRKRRMASNRHSVGATK